MTKSENEEGFEVKVVKGGFQLRSTTGFGHDPITRKSLGDLSTAIRPDIYSEEMSLAIESAISNFKTEEKL